MRKHQQILTLILAVGTLATLMTAHASYITLLIIFIYGNILLMVLGKTSIKARFNLAFYLTFLVGFFGLLAIAPQIKSYWLLFSFLYLTAIPSGLLTLFLFKAIKA